jgi:hypothetical protein
MTHIISNGKAMVTAKRDDAISNAYYAHTQFLYGFRHVNYKVSSSVSRTEATKQATVHGGIQAKGPGWRQWTHISK